MDMAAELVVSTHSRLKAAGKPTQLMPSEADSFNTQPPEGGWRVGRQAAHPRCSFNTQPPEGGWQPFALLILPYQSFNTQPPEGGWIVPP